MYFSKNSAELKVPNLDVTNLDEINKIMDAFGEPRTPYF